jgi:hypothetical protein
MELIFSCFSLSEVEDYLSNVAQMNRKWKEVEDNEPPVSDAIQLETSLFTVCTLLIPG